jgi:hypothetical protein
VAVGSWRQDDYSEVFAPLMKRYGTLPISRADFCRFGHGDNFDGFDRNHDGVLDVAEYQHAFLDTIRQPSWPDGPQR